ncbi:MAG TPA: DUF4405 domain-containing protein [Bacteroidales bacterium]|nr:DUF4405 domain-containing protein [Bacteroidales bacterium]
METDNKRRSALNSFIINNLLLLAVIFTVVSGLVLQVGFHMAETESQHGSRNVVHESTVGYEVMRGIDPLSTVWGIKYKDWSAIHKIAIVFFSALMIYHFAIHWKWYKGVLSKGLSGKHRQVLILTVLFLLVAATGFIPWFIDLSGGTSALRMVFIEVHDKITLILIIFLAMHLLKRIKWFRNTYFRIKNYGRLE